MKIDVFSTCYNEEIILPYFLKHYKQFASNITIFDNMSTDNSKSIMQDYGVNVIEFNTYNMFEEQVLIDIRNSCWKNSDADWVIVCDTDELIYHKDLVKLLSETNLTHIVAEGYEMMSENLPTTQGQIYEEIKMGFFKPDYSKPCIFKPSEITSINFDAGSHTASPKGNVISSNETGIKLLHYKYLNREVLINKYAHYKIRHSPSMRAAGWGNYQEWDAKVINNQFDTWLPLCKNVIDN